MAGIELTENNNYVTYAADQYKHLEKCRLVAIDGVPTMVPAVGPTFPDGDNVPLKNESNPNAAAFMEWSNSLVYVLQQQGKAVECHFTIGPSPNEVVVSPEDLHDGTRYVKVSLTVNRFFEKESAGFSSEVVKPGELTQGLCAPWQNDYRECACYYWAASRPDFVNVTVDEKGLSAGDNWMSKKRTGQYIPDDRRNSRLISYDDLFKNWESELSFIIKGKDAIQTGNKNSSPPA